MYGMPVAQLLDLIEPFVSGVIQSQRKALLKKLNADPQTPLPLTGVGKNSIDGESNFSSLLTPPRKARWPPAALMFLFTKIFSQ